MTPTTPQTPPAPTPPPANKPRRRKPGRCVVLHDVDWEMYTRLLKVFAEKPGTKLAYDRGELEIMSPSLRHDRGDRFLYRLVTALTEELGLPVISGGGTTLRRRKKQKGVEGDEVYWIAKAAQVAGVEVLNLKIHPPPDLAVEVDVSRSSLNRLGIYAALGVPEVWRLEKNDLRFYSLNADGKGYTEVTASRNFPLVAPADLLPFIQQARSTLNENVVIADFRTWFWQRIANPPPPPTTPPTP